MRLSLKLVLLAAPLVAAPVLFLGWSAGREIRQRIQAQDAESLRIAMERQRDEFDLLRREAVGELERLRQLPELLAYLETGDETRRFLLMQPNLVRHLDALLRAHRRVIDVRVAWTNGVLDTLCPPRAAGLPRAGTPEDYCEVLRASDSDEAWVEIRRHPDTGARCLFVGGRVMRPDRAGNPGGGRAVLGGYVAFFLDLERFAARAQGRLLASGGGLALLDVSGRPCFPAKPGAPAYPWGAGPLDLSQLRATDEGGLARTPPGAPYLAQAAVLTPGLLLVGYLPPQETDPAGRRIALHTILALGGCAAAVLALVLALRRSVLRPIRALTRAADQIGRGNLHIPIAFRSRDEMGALGRNIDSMRTSLMEARDASEAAQRQLEEKMLAAESASAAKSQFLANISHEIRTPINGVIGMLHLLRRSAVDDAQRHYADSALGSADMLMTVIGDVLDFSKIEAGRLELEVVPFSLHDAIDATVRLFAARAEAKGLEIAYTVAPEVPDTVRGDASRLRQILGNLLNNAVKFTERGDVSVACSVEEQDDAGAFIRFVVRDTGPGIQPGQRERIFESFTQGDETLNRRYGGTGLGLAICRRLVRMMDGRIGVDSEPGQGASFWFVVRVERDPAQAPMRRRRATTLRGVRLLIADDAAAARQVVRDYALAWGCDVCEAVSLAEAEERLAAASPPFDLVILERALLGAEATPAGLLAHAAAGGALPRVILVHAFSNTAAIEGVPAVDVLTKPLRASDLYNAIVSALHPVTAPPARLLPARGGLPPPDPGLAAIRVLVAEDNPVNREVARELLLAMGYACECVENGADAVERVQTGRFDLVLMDCQMPVMDGYEATRAIREWEQSRDGREPALPVPIIALTAHALAGDRERCTAAGMSDYMPKPVQPERLDFVLRAWLSHRLGQGPAATGAAGGHAG